MQYFIQNLGFSIFRSLKFLAICLFCMSFLSCNRKVTIHNLESTIRSDLILVDSRQPISHVYGISIQTSAASTNPTYKSIDNLEVSKRYNHNIRKSLNKSTLLSSRILKNKSLNQDRRQPTVYKNRSATLLLMLLLNPLNLHLIYIGRYGLAISKFLLYISMILGYIFLESAGYFNAGPGWFDINLLGPIYIGAMIFVAVVFMATECALYESDRLDPKNGVYDQEDYNRRRYKSRKSKLYRNNDPSGLDN